jgi:hypothetical protein
MGVEMLRILWPTLALQEVQTEEELRRSRLVIIIQAE